MRAGLVTGIVDATDLETTAQYEGCGQVTRKRRITDTRDKVHEIEVTVYGWMLIMLIEASPKIPLAATVVPIHEHATLALRALVTQARTTLAGMHACTRSTSVTTTAEIFTPTPSTLWWSASGTIGTTDQAATWSFRPMPRGRNPCSPSMTMDDRRLIENCYIKESKQLWSVKHPPQKTARAARIHIMSTLLMFALATAYRLPCEQADTGNGPVSWQRWRRQLLERTGDHVIVLAQDCYGIFHFAAYSLLLGVKLKDVPPRIGTHQEILAQFELAAHG